MSTTVKLVGLYVVCLGAVAGCFVLVGLSKASWGEVGPLVSAIVLGLAGIHASAITGTTGSPTSASSPAPSSGSSTPAGVGSAGHAG